jgi:uncharacterized protein (TIGR03435 family)
MSTLRRFSMNVTLLMIPFFAGAQVRPQFEVVAIKPAGPRPPQSINSADTDGSQVYIPWTSLRGLTSKAFHVKTYQIFGPPWFDDDHFEIVAKIPDGSNQQNVPEMLQSMLQDRFGMKSHWEKKEVPVYALGFSKTVPNLKKVAAPETELSAPKVNITSSIKIIDFGGGSTLSFTDNVVDAKKVTLDEFVDFFGDYLDRPRLINNTKLDGHYDFRLTLSPPDFQKMFMWALIKGGLVPPPAELTEDATSLDSLAKALKDVGLKLERAAAPIDALIIDSVQKKPTDN